MTTGMKWFVDGNANRWFTMQLEEGMVRHVPDVFYKILGKAVDKARALVCTVDGTCASKYNAYIIHTLMNTQQTLLPPRYIDYTLNMSLVIADAVIWCTYVSDAPQKDHTPMIDGSCFLQVAANGIILQTALSEDGYVTLQSNKWIRMLQVKSNLTFKIFKKRTGLLLNAFEVSSEYIMPPNENQCLEIRPNRFWVIQVFNSHVKMHFVIESAQ